MRFSTEVQSNTSSGNEVGSEARPAMTACGGFCRLVGSHVDAIVGDVKGRKIDRIAALKSAPWGAFQIMGFNQ